MVLRSVWPLIRAEFPDARLEIAGSVACAFPGGGPKGTRFHGLVDLPVPFYERAGVIVSPLTLGSGLKIKLIETLTAGKAIVATPMTLQGVQAECEGAVACTDDPAAFAAHIAALSDDGLNARQATFALAAADAHFSAESC